ncbi:MAG: DUF4160 domain-containing protein [Terriglobia bacterium]
MPTILRSGPYRFFFYSADNREPPHVHIEREEKIAKFWLDPVRIQSSGGFSRKEIGTIQKLVEENASALLGSWNEFFSRRGQSGPGPAGHGHGRKSHR